MSLGRLLLAALLVSPIASCGASLIVAGTSATGPMEPGIALAAFLFLTVMATMVSLLFVLAALLVIALPLSLLLNGLGVPAIARDLILLAVAGAAGYLLSPLSAQAYEGHAWIYMTYCLTSAMLWILALRFVSRRSPAPAAHG